jgi:hypothetical protein
MGANAQTTVPTFTTGQVLTADQQNQSARTGVPVFASTVTRDAGFGGTGEKTLAEGQLCYVEGVGLQSYNAAGAWVTWGAAPSAGALTLVKSQTIGTAVSSVTVTDAFSSTYDNYKITISSGVGSTTAFLLLQFGATTTAYYSAFISASYGGGTSSNNQSNTASARCGLMTSNSLFASIDVFSPNLAKVTQFACLPAPTSDTGEQVYTGGGWQNSTTQFTAFTISPATGTITGGTIRVYGYQNS